MAFEIDDDVSAPEPGSKAERVRNVPANEARDFWTAHAAYWRERGNFAKAEECEREAANAKR